MTEPSLSHLPPPAFWEVPLQNVLQSGEVVGAWFEPDLNDNLKYAKGFVAVTNHRVLACVVPLASGDFEPQTGSDNWQSWPLQQIASVRCREHFGLGTLDALASDCLLARWRFTSRGFVSANRFAKRANALIRGELGLLRETATVCPSCGAVLGADETTCSACAPAAQLPPTKTLLRLMPFAQAWGGRLLIGFILAVLGTLGALVPPYLTKPLLDEYLVPFQNGKISADQLAPIWWYIGGMALAAVAAWLLSWGKTWLLTWVAERISADLRNASYSHLQKLSLEYFGGKRTGDLISRVGSDSDRICNFLSLNLVDFANDLLTIAIASVLLLTTDFRLALVTLIPFPVIAWLINRVRKQLRHGFAQSGRAWASMVSVLADTIPGIRVVKAFAQERREVERFEHANDHVLVANDRVNQVWSFFGPMVGLLTEVGVLIVWLYAAWQITHPSGGHQLQVGTLMLFFAYISRFYTRLDSMSRMLANTQRAAAAAHRIFEILDRVPSVAEPVKPVHPGRVSGRIELKNVKFSYGTRQVIRGVNLTIEPGEMIGLVGPSGAGKSTLVNLVCRFYDVASGSISVDGVDIRSYPIEEYRKNIGIVLQEPFLFYGTVAENIAYARPDATREQILEAAKAARAHEFILRLPDGYDSVVGERGQSLSGGERQRISIARALLTDPRILILDEATSSVDTETEREIQEALDVLTRGRTTIAIAHRLSTLRNANRLVVMEDGQVSEVGAHGELLEQNGVYARLHQAQYELANATSDNAAP